MSENTKDTFALAHRLSEMASKPWAKFYFSPYKPKTIFRPRVSYTVKLGDKEAFIINGDGVFKHGIALPIKKNEHRRLLDLVMFKAKERRQKN